MKTIIITGASSGIGKAIAKALCKKYEVINIDILPSTLKDVTYYECDLSSKKALRATIKTIKKEYQNIYALINNAAVFEHIELEKQSIKTFEKIMHINVTAPYILSKAFAKQLVGGHIINISSTRALMSEAGTEAYSASKGAISSLTHALAASLAPKTKVNAIAPGWINTTLDEPSKEDHEQHLSGRVGEVEDIVQAVKFLLKNRGFITGTQLVIDGGMTKKMIYK